MRYLIERLPGDKLNEDEQIERVFEILEMLAETENLEIFKSGFIRRLIDY